MGGEAKGMDSGSASELPLPVGPSLSYAISNKEAQTQVFLPRAKTVLFLEPWLPTDSPICRLNKRAPGQMGE
jgi:hypothetical protein